MDSNGASKEQVDSIASATRVVLARTFGGQVRVGDGNVLDSSGRSQVYRFPVTGAPQAIESVIVKQAGGNGRTYDPGVASPDAIRFFSEWASLQFLGMVTPEDDPAPHFFGGDRESGIIALEDLGEREHLHTLLLGGDAADGEKGLVALAATLGRMHAATVGKGEAFRSIRSSLGPDNPEIFFYDYSWIPGVVHDSLRALDIQPHPSMDKDLETLRTDLLHPAPFEALVHEDPCPDNCLLVDGKVRLFDFELGHFGPALVDGVYGRIHFPSCWCVQRIPRGIPELMEQAYRTELARGCPQAAEDGPFYRAVLEACIYSVLKQLSWYSMQEHLQGDREWGLATLRQRLLLRMPIIVKTAKEVHHLQALLGAVAEMADKLETLWGPAIQPLQSYPAFR